MLIYVILSTVIFFLAPSVAHAWGPGTHIEIALSMLEKMALMAPVVRAVIAGREEWFLYGSVAADIVVGKKFAGEYDHRHNWHVGQQVLRAARTDRERAAAYGYLTHLAADVIAHNYLIPFMMVKSYRARLLSHTYWEMRFDMHVRQGVWDKMSKMILGDFSPFDKLLGRVLKNALFSFKTSKHIFSGILAFQRFKQVRRTFSVYAKKSRYALDIDDVSHYMRLALGSAGRYLADPKGADCLGGDPTGTSKIEYAGWLRWRIKSALRKKQVTKVEVEHFLVHVKQRLLDNVNTSDIALPSLDGFKLKHLRT